MIVSRIFIACMLIVWTAYSPAQTNNLLKYKVDVTSVSAQIELPKTNEMSEVSFSIILENSTDKRIIISKIQQGCSCIITSQTVPFSIESGASASIAIDAMVYGNIGINKTTVSFFNEEAELILPVDIVTDVTKAFEITPSRTILKPEKLLEKDVGLTFSLSCANLPLESLTYELDPSWAKYFRVIGPNKLLPNERAEITIVKTQQFKLLPEDIPPYGYCKVIQTNAESQRFVWAIKN